MSTIQQYKYATTVAIRNKTLPSSVTRANVADRLDAAGDELLARGMLQAADTAGLAAVSKDNTRAVVVPGIGLFTALQTGSAADNVTTFPSADAGWLWFLAVQFVTGLPLSSLLAATGPNTINNVANTQEWQFPMVSGGTGFKISADRIADDAVTPETLLALSLAGSVTLASRSRPIKVMSIVAGLTNRPRIKLLNLEYTDASFTPPHADTSVLHINTLNGNVPALRMVTLFGEAIFGTSSLQLFQFNGSGQVNGNLAIATSSTTTAALTISNTLNALALEISDHLDVVNPLRANAAFQTISAAAKNACVSIGPSRALKSSLCIESGVAPTTPNNGDFWIESNHLFCRLNGVTRQLDEPDGANFYNGDGALSGARAVDMAGFPLTFNNAALFRIQDAGPDTGIYDFNEGVDFLVANATKSYSILKDLVNGIRLKSIDITGGITKEIVVDTTQVKVDSSVLKLVNLPTFANDAAAGALAADTVYKTATGELRIKL